FFDAFSTSKIEKNLWPINTLISLRNPDRPLIRYVTIYLIGYVVSFSGLYIFADMLGFSHQLIQGLMIVLVAILLFTLQRVWVFNQSLDKSGQICKHGAP
ncbi:MAG: hypothetical protein LC541_09605, partial [Candidatus Thiodiazotropha sp.]|nr:hypothetical protein [Candidatus Thiodiazotropha sp.]MCM8883536.1 hypothetical protein [Candidatus Thiodiazotropha sp.]